MPVLSSIGGQLNLVIGQATDFGPVTLNFTNPNGTPVDLTGCTLASSLRKTPTGPVLASFVCTVTNAAGGVATMFMGHAVTGGLAAGPNVGDYESQYQWDLKLTDATGNVSRPLYGQCNVLRDITP